MKHIKTFESFSQQHVVNEAENYSALLAGITKNYAKIKAETDFEKAEITVKNCSKDDDGNQFLYACDGDCQIYYMSNADIKKNDFGGDNDNEIIIKDGGNSIAVVYI